MIQALNKQAAPERFTEGDARAVRTLAPAIAAGSRLILSLLRCSRENQRIGAAAGHAGLQQSPSFGQNATPADKSSFRSPEELLLREGLRRAREGLGADRARVFVLLDSEVAAGGELRLWCEDPPPPSRSGWARSAGLGLERGSGGCVDGVGGKMDAEAGLQGVALSTGRVARSADALSDSKYDRELDIRDGFLARSAICAPLLVEKWEEEENAGEEVDGEGKIVQRMRAPPLGILQLVIGRGGVGEDVSSGTRGSRGGLGESDLRRKRFFGAEDEPLAEAFAEEVTGLLSCLLHTGFRPRASATTLVGGGGHAGAGGIVKNPLRRSSTFGEQVGGHAASGGPRSGIPGENLSRGGAAARRWGLVGQQAVSPRSLPPPADTAEPRLPVQNFSTASERRRHGHRETVGEVEARDSVVRGPLASSMSTAGASPLGGAVRASTATAGKTTPPAALPPPPSPATDDSCSPRGQNQDGPVSGGEKAALKQHQEVVEATQAQSWATAHRVLAACKEGLAADKRLREIDDYYCSIRRSDDDEGDFRSVTPATTVGSGASNSESIAPAVRALVSSLLPGCSAVLLLLDKPTGHLRYAERGGALSQDSFEGARLPLSPRHAVRREDVARRALSSGKALLAQAGEDRGGGDNAVGHEWGVSGGHRKAVNVRHSGDGDGDDDGDGERVFCVPVCGSAGHNVGVLQIFFPPPPPALVQLGEDPAPSSPRGGSRPPGATRAVALRPPPPSFFMATKIVADCVGLALGWCDALDREEKARKAAAVAFAAAGEANAEAQKQSRRELAARREKDSRVSAERQSARVAEAADEHARAMAVLFEEREALAAAASEAMVRAKRRRDAVRVIVAWREALKRAQKATANGVKMGEFRGVRALKEWRSRASTRGKGRKVEGTGAAVAEKRGLRRAVRAWTRATARGRCMAERRLAGARLIAETYRRNGPAKRCFSVWKRAAQGLLTERQALARKLLEEKLQAHAGEVSFGGRGFSVYNARGLLVWFRSRYYCTTVRTLSFWFTLFCFFQGSSR